MGRRVKKTITSKMGMIGGCLWAEDKKPVEKGAGYVWKTNWKTEQGKSSLFLPLTLVVPPHFCLQSYFLYLHTLSMLSAILTVLIPTLLTNSTSPALAQNSGASFSSTLWITCWTLMSCLPSNSISKFTSPVPPSLLLPLDFSLCYCEIFIFLVPLREILTLLLAHPFSSFPISSYEPDPVKFTFTAIPKNIPFFYLYPHCPCFRTASHNLSCGSLVPLHLISSSLILPSIQPWVPPYLNTIVIMPLLYLKPTNQLTKQPTYLPTNTFCGSQNLKEKLKSMTYPASQSSTLLSLPSFKTLFCFFPKEPLHSIQIVYLLSLLMWFIWPEMQFLTYS